MKANELMIGDWVEFTSKYGYGTGQIAAIEPREGAAEPTTFSIIKNKQDGSHFYVGVSKNCVRPIPLTAEILEKNGFKNDFYEEESVADYHTIRLEGYSLRHNIGEVDGYLVTWCNGGINVTTDFHGCVQKDIPYVHELQHALRLCGIEKEIEL